MFKAYVPRQATLITTNILRSKNKMAWQESWAWVVCEFPADFEVKSADMQCVVVVILLTLCYPGRVSVHIDQRSISCTTADWPTCFPMNLPHILSNSQIFLKFIEQRRLFFLVWYGFVKNFAREMTTLWIVGSAPPIIEHSQQNAKSLPQTYTVWLYRVVKGIR